MSVRSLTSPCSDAVFRARDCSSHPSDSSFGLSSVAKNCSRQFCRTKGFSPNPHYPPFPYKWVTPIHKEMAESEGFEPSIRFPVYTLSRGAPSATRPALRISVCLAHEHLCLRNHGARARYFGRPALSPLGSLRSCKIAPGDFVLRAPCPKPFGLASLVQNRSRRFCTAGSLP